MDLKRQDLDQVHGKTLYSSDGDKLGDVQDVVLDDRTGEPEWVRIGVGLFGMKDVLVPLALIETHSDGLQVSMPKDKVKDAPAVAENVISPEAESELYKYYGLTTSPSELNEARGTPDEGLKEREPVESPLGGSPGGERQTAPHVPEEQSLTARGNDPPTQVRLRKWVP